MLEQLISRGVVEGPMILRISPDRLLHMLPNLGMCIQPLKQQLQVCMMKKNLTFIPQNVQHPWLYHEQNEVNGVSLFPISHLCAYTEKIASSVVALSGSCNTRIPAWEKAQSAQPGKMQNIVVAVECNFVVILGPSTQKYTEVFMSNEQHLTPSCLDEYKGRSKRQRTWHTWTSFFERNTTVQQEVLESIL